MTRTQSLLIMTISETLTDLSSTVTDEKDLIKLNAAHFMLVKLAKSMSDEQSQPTVQA